MSTIMVRMKKVLPSATEYKAESSTEMGPGTRYSIAASVSLESSAHTAGRLGE
jgi:hypothetical protein